MIAGDLFATCRHITLPDSLGSVDVTDVVEDSREATPGSIFIARNGSAEHGSHYAKDAIQRGAALVLTDADADISCEAPVVRSPDVKRDGAILAERFHGDPSRSLRVMTVTGTNGKTTVAHLIQQFVRLCGGSCGLLGTVHVDDGRVVTPARLTTPGAVEVSRTLARMVTNGCECVAMEASSHALDQGRLAGLAIDVAVFTNLSGDHLDYHGTMGQYAAAKASLFAALDASGVAIVNADDAAWRDMVKSTKGQVVRCTVQSAEAEARIVEQSSSIDGAQLHLSGPFGDLRGVCHLPGAHNQMNLLQAVCSANAAGVDVSKLNQRLHELTAPPGRLERVTVDTGAVGPVVLVDYAHTDDALASALRAVRPLVPGGGRLWVVFGCGGDRDAKKRPRMGAVASSLADRIVITSDNPRSEAPGAIIEAIARGIDASLRENVVEEADRAKAIHHAIHEAKESDLILIAGKGHEDYQVVSNGAGGTVRRDFDDRKVARQALQDRMAAAVS